jgi:ABC-type nickel/cobalt efflux system permease component RcnA
MLELQRWLYAGATTQLKSFSSAIEPMTLLAGIGIAAVFGFVHALMPGHGKTVLVSYFLGRSGNIRASLMTSLILVLTHVGSAVLMVLAGFIVIRATIGGAGRAPAFETASAVFITFIGIWLLYNAVRHQHHDSNPQNGTMLALATGLVPCPLTTFIMVYAVTNGIIAAGLLLTASMASGMVATIALFATATVFLRQRILDFFERTTDIRDRAGQILELVSAAAITGFGVWLLTSR